MNPKSLAIAGGAGFIGTNLIRYWSRLYPSDLLTVIDKAPEAVAETNLSALDGNWTYRRLDIRDTANVERVLADAQVDVVINLAAESHVSAATADPIAAFETNVLGTVSLLEASRRVRVARFHQVSTCEVYGDLPLDGDRAYREGAPYRPNSPYSASKAGADHAVEAYRHTYGLPASTSLSCNNYGPYQFPEKLIPLFVTNAIMGLPLPMYASKGNRREWIHVEDHCRALDAILHRGSPGRRYHVGSSEEYSVEEITDKLLVLLKASGDLKTVVADRPGHSRRHLLDSTTTRMELGWAPEIDFDFGLEQTAAWYEKHHEWWSPLVQSRRVDESHW